MNDANKFLACMKNVILFSFLTLQILFCLGQPSNTEFEGRIYYINSYKIHNPRIDSIELVKSLGSSSIYTYKSGRYIWRSEGSQFQYEIYNSFQGLLVDKFAENDTLYKKDIYKENDSLISYKIVENADTICGYNCNAITVVLQSFRDKGIIKRTLFYSSGLAINPKYFTNYRSYANNKIYPLIKAVPLRIILEFEWLPVEITMNAYKVEQAAINDKEFELDKSLFVK